MKEGSIDNISGNGSSKLGWVLAGAALGSIAVFFYDPNSGRRRRALVRDRIVELRNDSNWYMNKKSRNVANHVEGWLARFARAFRPRSFADDETIVKRVRAALGRKVRHPHSIHVSARDGEVFLQGVILADEVKPLFNCVRDVRGVRRVVNQLEVHRSPDHVSGLQGRGKEYKQQRSFSGARVRRGSMREKNQELDNRVKRMLRSKRVIANPGAITVQVSDDVVVLSGPIFRSEVEFLLEAVRALDGVGDVIDRLEVHDTAERVAGLQGRPLPIDREVTLH